VELPHVQRHQPDVLGMSNVGPFADAACFAETLCAGIVYGAAVTELLLQQSAIDSAWTTADDLTDEDIDALVITDELLEVRWRITSLMLGIEA
jgi:hypothetical protein